MKILIMMIRIILKVIPRLYQTPIISAVRALNERLMRPVQCPNKCSYSFGSFETV